MSEHQASRTLVKSPPELWAECSDARSLARHLGDAVGEIRINRLEPETTVAWEGERISGTVRLEPSGWGTKVTLTAASDPPMLAEDPEPVAVAAPEPPAPEPSPEPSARTEPPAPEPTPEPSARTEPPAPEPTPEPSARTGLVARFRRWFGSAPIEPAPVQAPVAPAPPPEEPTAEPTVEPEPAANQVDLIAALDSLGKAHHRPFSRA